MTQTQDRDATHQPIPDTAAADAAFTMARRFADGATLWCLSPSWPEHARHVAVEFVHPVIMGARALPSLVVGGPGHISNLRSIANAGDLLLAVGECDDTVILDAMRRAPAWGLTTIWCGFGALPDEPRADHLLWLDDPEGHAPYDGRVALMYHLLWELTQVCFEHPGLLQEVPEDDEAHCTTCSDYAQVAEVVSVGDGNDADVRMATGPQEVDVSLVSPLSVDDLILVHAGTAIGVVE